MFRGYYQKRQRKAKKKQHKNKKIQYTCEQYKNLSEGKKPEKRQYGCE